MMKKTENTKDWQSFFKGKKITVMGLGLLGRGVGDIEFLAKYADEIIVTDLKSAKDLRSSLDALKRFKNIKYTLGKHNKKDFENRSFILKAAGVPINSPFILHTRTRGVPVYMSTALFAMLSPSKIIGITGTRGKTTVTNMIYDILNSDEKRKTRNGRRKIFLGGNIQGVSTLPIIAKARKGDVAILELDSWQLQGFGDLNISPNLAVMTTFMPDHLNYYKGDLKAYFRDKANIWNFQKTKDILIVGEQVCSLPASFTNLLPKKARFVSEKVLPKSWKLKVPGEHNRYNASMAYVVARRLKVPVATIFTVLSKFKGVSGRLEKIAKKGGISIYNDTTSTTPQSLITAIEALGKGKNISLIMGGTDKFLPLSGIGEALTNNCAWVSLLVGSGTDRLLKEKILPTTVPSKVFKSLSPAVLEALRRVPKNGVVLFSPGFASFGMFKNEYDRGEKFIMTIKLFTAK